MARRKRKVEPFDPALFEDPVALQTRWGGAADNAQPDKDAHRVLADVTSELADADRLLFRNASSGTWATWRRLLEGAALAVILFVVMNHPKGQFISVVYGIGLVYWIYQQFETHLHYVFDKVEGVYWRGRKELSQDTEARPLEDIYAVQLICTDSYTVRGRGSHWSECQVNLVFEGGQREVVTSWRCRDSVIRELRAEAQALADFLDRPLWDATDTRRLDILRRRQARQSRER